MAFHRLTVPSYFGGIGANDYLNNAVTGTPAAADGPKSAGTNAGTYFVGFAEDGISQAWNRGLKALGQNTDQLDDWFHRDLIDPQMVSATAPGGGTTSIVLTGPAFVGVPGTPNTPLGIATFVTLTDAYDNDIYNGGVLCQVTAITGATPGDNFSTGNITLTVSPAIPAGTVYRVYYSTRTNLTAEAVDMPLKNRRTYHKYKGGPLWFDGTTNPPTTIPAQLDKIVADLSAATGADKVGSSGIAGSPHSLSAGAVHAQLNDLLLFVNNDYAARVSADNTINTTLTKYIAYIRSEPALNVETYYDATSTVFKTGIYNPVLRCWHLLGFLGRAQRSLDFGLTWGSTETSGVTVDFVSAAVNTTNGNLVVGATGNKIYKCVSFSWTNVTVSAADEWYVAYDPATNLYCAFGSDIGVMHVATSPDAVTWTARTLPATLGAPYKQIVDMKSDGVSRLIMAAVHNAGTTIYFAESTNGGVTWADTTTITVPAAPASIALLYDSYSSKWIFVAKRTAASAYCKVWTSINNGASWTLATTLTSYMLSRIAAMDGIWLALGDGPTSTDLVASSDSGVTWYPTGFSLPVLATGVFASTMNAAGALILGPSKAWVTARSGPSVNAFTAIT